MLRKPGKLLCFSRRGLCLLPHWIPLEFPAPGSPALLHLQIPEVSGCAAWSLPGHFGLCHVDLLELKWELPPSFIFGVWAVLGRALPAIPAGSWSAREPAAPHEAPTAAALHRLTPELVPLGAHEELPPHSRELKKQHWGHCHRSTPSWRDTRGAPTFPETLQQIPSKSPQWELSNGGAKAAQELNSKMPEWFGWKGP